MKTALASFVALLSLASPGFAATVEWERHTATIDPGTLYQQALGCKTGSLLSGGYLLDNVNHGNGPFSKIVVVINAPVPDNTWHVGFLNDSGAPADIDFRISILCTAE